MLTLYRDALALRRKLPALGDGQMAWIEAGHDLLAFRREPGFMCVVNLGDKPAHVARELLPEGTIVLASGPVDAGGEIPGATAAWYAQD